MRVGVILLLVQIVVCEQSDEEISQGIDKWVVGLMVVGTLLLGVLIWDHRNNNYYRLKLMDKLLRLRNRMRRNPFNRMKLASDQKSTINTFEVQRFTETEASAAMDLALPSPVDLDSNNYNLQLPSDTNPAQNINHIFNEKKSYRPEKSKLRKKINSTQIKETQSKQIPQKKEHVESQIIKESESDFSLPCEIQKSPTEESTQ